MGKQHGSTAGKGINLIAHNESEDREIFQCGSDSDKRKSYHITHDLEQGGWACTCPSWVYQNGTDEEGDCKHIRFAKAFK